MRDVHIAETAGKQFNRISLAQLRDLGLSEKALRHRVDAGRLTRIHDGVFAVAPVDEGDDWGKWMGATLTGANSVLSHRSCAAARGFWTLRRPFEEITRPGRGGRRRYAGLRVYRSDCLDGFIEEVCGIPAVAAAQTLLDLAPQISERALAWCVREAVRLDETSLGELATCLGAHQGRRGTRPRGAAIARYSGLPIEDARSGAEVRALEILRDAGRPHARAGRAARRRGSGSQLGR